VTTKNEYGGNAKGGGSSITRKVAESYGFKAWKRNGHATTETWTGGLSGSREVSGAASKRKNTSGTKKFQSKGIRRNRSLIGTREGFSIKDN